MLSRPLQLQRAGGIDLSAGHPAGARPSAPTYLPNQLSVHPILYSPGGGESRDEGVVPPGADGQGGVGEVDAG